MTQITLGRQAIEYHTRDIGYGVEEGVADAYVTDEIDTWGKRTIFVSHNAGETWEQWYLFPDEWETAGA